MKRAWLGGCRWSSARQSLRRLLRPVRLRGGRSQLGVSRTQPSAEPLDGVRFRRSAKAGSTRRRSRTKWGAWHSAASAMDFPPWPPLSQQPSRYCSAAPALHLDRCEDRLGIPGGGGAALFQVSGSFDLSPFLGNSTAPWLYGLKDGPITAPCSSAPRSDRLFLFGLRDLPGGLSRPIIAPRRVNAEYDAAGHGVISRPIWVRYSDEYRTEKHPGISFTS